MSHIKSATSISAEIKNAGQFFVNFCSIKFHEDLLRSFLAFFTE